MKFSIQEYRRINVISVFPESACSHEIKIMNCCDWLFEAVAPVMFPVYQEFGQTDGTIRLTRIQKQRIAKEINSKGIDVFENYDEIKEFYKEFHFSHTMQYVYICREFITRSPKSDKIQVLMAEMILSPPLMIAIFPPNIPAWNEETVECAYLMASTMESIYRKDYGEDLLSGVRQIIATGQEGSRIYKIPDDRIQKRNAKIAESRRKTETLRTQGLRKFLDEICQRAKSPRHSLRQEAAAVFRKNRAKLKTFHITNDASLVNRIIREQKNRRSNQSREEKRTASEDICLPEEKLTAFMKFLPVIGKFSFLPSNTPESRIARFPECVENKENQTG